MSSNAGRRPVFAAFVAAVCVLSAEAHGADSDLSRPFTELRHAFAASPAFSGSWVADPERQLAMKALEEKRSQDFLLLSAAWLQKLPVDARVHLARAAVLAEAGDFVAAAHHRFAFYGLLESILASGDGRSMNTAFRVISVDEEYTVLSFMGETVSKQRLDGGVDVLELNRKGAPNTMYFDVNIGLAATVRALGAKHE
jgi:hypothetical protein